MNQRLINYFNKVAQYLEIDLLYFAKGSFWLTLSQIIVAVFGFALSLLYARFLPKLTFGQYTYVFSFISFFGSLAHPGMQTAVIRAVAQKRDLVLKEAAKKTFPWAMMSAVPFLGLIAFYLLKPVPDYALASVFLLCFGLSPIFWSFRFYTSYFIGREKFKGFFFASLLSKAILLLAIAPIIVFLPTVFHLTLANLGTSTLFGVGITFFLYRQLNKKLPTKEDFSYATSLNDVRIFSFLTSYVDKIIIAKFLGFEAVATYTFAQVFPEQINGFLKNFSVLALPKLSQSRLQGKRRLFYQKLGQFFLLTLGLVIGYILLSPIFFRFFFPAYLDSVALSKIFALSLLFTPALAITALFESRGKTSHLRRQTYPTYTLQLILLILLTVKFGLVGTVCAVAITRFFNLFLSLFLLQSSPLFSGRPQ